LERSRSESKNVTLQWVEEKAFGWTWRVERRTTEEEAARVFRALRVRERVLRSRADCRARAREAGPGESAMCREEEEGVEVWEECGERGWGSAGAEADAEEAEPRSASLG